MMKKIFGGIIGLIIIAVLILYFMMDSLAKSAINAMAPELLGVPVSVESVTISPIGGKASIKGLFVGNPEGFSADYAFKLESIEVQLQAASLLSDAISIQEVTIDKPQIVYELGWGGSNIDAIMANLADDNAAEATDMDSPEGGDGAHIEIDNLYIRDAQVTTALGALGTTLPIPTIHMQNIGKDDQDSNLDEVIWEILGAILQSLKKIDLSKADKSANDGALQKLGDGLSALFGGKNEEATAQ